MRISIAIAVLVLSCVVFMAHTVQTCPTTNPLEGFNFTLDSDITDDLANETPETTEVEFAGFLTEPVAVSDNNMCPDLTMTCCSAETFTALKQQFAGYRGFINRIRKNAIKSAKQARTSVRDFEKKCSKLRKQAGNMGVDGKRVANMSKIVSTVVRTFNEYRPELLDAMASCMKEVNAWVAGFICLACTPLENGESAYVTQTDTTVTYSVNESAIDTIVDKCSDALITVPLKVAKKIQAVIDEVVTDATVDSTLPVDPSTLDTKFTDMITELSSPTISEEVRQKIKAALAGPDVSWFYGEEGVFFIMEQVMGTFRAMHRYGKSNSVDPRDPSNKPSSSGLFSASIRSLSTTTTTNVYTDAGFDPIAIGTASAFETIVEGSEPTSGGFDLRQAGIIIGIAVLIILIVGGIVILSRKHKVKKQHRYDNAPVAFA